MCDPCPLLIAEFFCIYPSDGILRFYFIFRLCGLLLVMSSMCVIRLRHLQTQNQDILELEELASLFTGQEAKAQESEGTHLFKWLIIKSS